MRKCISCQYYDRDDGRSDDGSAQRWGRCRRALPTVNPTPAKAYMVEGVWPQIRDDDWCGEWTAVEHPAMQSGPALETRMPEVGPVPRAPLMTPPAAPKPAVAFAAPPVAAVVELQPMARSAGIALAASSAD